MKRLTLMALVFTLGLGGAFTILAAEESDILGHWATTPTERGYAKVEVYEDGGKYFGKIIWLEKPTYDESEGPEWAGKTKVNRKSPDKKEQDKPIVGLHILNDMKFAGKDQWEDGTIYDPENGKTYKCKISLDGDTLNVRGFIGFSLLGRTSQWTRVKDQ